MKLCHSRLAFLTKSCEHSLMWKGDGVGGIFRDQWEVESEGVKGCQKGGITGRVFLFQYYTNYRIVTAIVGFAFFILIGEGRKCKKVLVVGFVV